MTKQNDITVQRFLPTYNSLRAFYSLLLINGTDSDVEWSRESSDIKTSTDDGRRISVMYKRRRTYIPRYIAEADTIGTLT